MAREILLHSSLLLSYETPDSFRAQATVQQISTLSLLVLLEHLPPEFDLLSHIAESSPRIRINPSIRLYLRSYSNKARFLEDAWEFLPNRKILSLQLLYSCSVRFLYS